MDLLESLRELAVLNRHGVAFLTAFGLTWVVCALLWRKISEQRAALATLLQGAVGLPLALLFTYLIGAFGVDRPVEPVIEQLSVLISVSQMLGFPLAIYFYATKQYRLVPFILASVVAIHFVFYSWLYQSPLYIVMAGVIVVGTALAMGRAERKGRPGPTPQTASTTCLITGLALLGTGGLLQII